MKKLIFILCLLLSNTAWSGDNALSKELVASLQNAFGQLERLESQFPALQNQNLDINMFDTKAQMTLIDKVGATDAVSEIVKSAGFDNIESFLGYSQRVMSSMFTVMKEQMPAGANMDALIKQQESAIASMKSSGMPEAALEEMKKGIADMKAQATRMAQAASKAEPEDVDFMRENFAWVMQQFNH